MENQFKVNDSAEAIDSVGCWARCTIIELREDQYYVSFDGWSRKWNRVVSSDEIRAVTVVQTATKRSSNKKGNLSVETFHFERGDEVSLKTIDGLETGEVVFIDPFQNQICLATPTGERVVTASDVIPSTDGEIPPKRQKRDTQSEEKRMRRPVKSSNASQSLCDESDLMDEQQRTSHVSSRELHLPCAVAAKSFVSVGDFCTFAGLVVMINSIIMERDIVFATCLICKLKENTIADVYCNSELKCPTKELHRSFLKVNSTISKLSRKSVATAQQCIHMTCLKANSHIAYKQMVRQVRICRQITSDISSTLAGKSFKRTFEYVLDCYDYDLFCLNEQNRYETLNYLEHGFECFDTLFFPAWDVKWDATDPTSKYTFVRSLRIKCNIHSLVVTVVKAHSSSPFTESYRSQAVLDLKSIQREVTDVEMTLDTAPHSVATSSNLS